MAESLSDRQSVVLAALAAGGAAEMAPVQVQKLFFLLDENVAADLGGKQFSFEPYNYGPFDLAVYHELEALERRGFVRITPGTGRQRRYSLTAAGERVGQETLARLPSTVAGYMSVVSKWVRSLTFAELVGSVYKAFPHMRKNSIFVD